MRISDWSSDVCSSDLEPLYDALRENRFYSIARTAYLRACDRSSRNGQSIPKETSPMLKVGDRFPAYALKAVDAKSTPETFHELSNASLGGKWGVYFFWPQDFHFVCPPEFVGLDPLHGAIGHRPAQLVGLSNDTDF